MSSVQKSKQVRVSFPEIERAAQIAASNVVRRSPLDFEELVQVAWIAILDGLLRYDEALGKFEPYAVRAGIYACRRASYKVIGSPVPQEHIPEVPWTCEPDWNLESMVERPLDEKFEYDEWRARVRVEVRRVLKEVANPEIIRVISGYADYNDVTPVGSTLHNVHNKAWKIRNRLRQSEEIKQLWDELHE